MWLPGRDFLYNPETSQTIQHSMAREIDVWMKRDAIHRPGLPGLPSNPAGQGGDLLSPQFGMKAQTVVMPKPEKKTTGAAALGLVRIGY